MAAERASPSQKLQSAFTAGELAPALAARTDLAKFHSGARLLRNVVVHPQGGVSNRPGTEFVAYTREQGAPVRLIPFEFNVSQAYVLEFGPGYVRFHRNGAPVPGPDGSPYEVATPYRAADLAGLKFAQANDILTLTHPGHPPADLKRRGEASWTYERLSFATSLAAPLGVAVDTTHDAGAINSAKVTLPVLDYEYAVTAVSVNPADESGLSASASCRNFGIGYYSQFGVLNTVRWQAVPGVDHYNVYRRYLGAWAFVGSTAETAFRDENTRPDVATTPPQHYDPFAEGAIEAVTVTAQGDGYSSAARVVLADPTGRGAVLVPQWSGRRLVGVVVQSGGWGYTAPVVSVVDPGADEPTLVTDGNVDSLAELFAEAGEVFLGLGSTVPVRHQGGGAAAAATVSARRNFPATVSYYQQRRVFGGSAESPQALWLTRSGNYYSMDTSSPVRADDAITATIASRQANAIAHVLPLRGLLVLTGGGAWRVSGGTKSDVLTPTAFVAEPQTYTGCSPTVPPLVVGDDVVFVQAKGSGVRSMSYNAVAEGYVSTDLMLLSPHLLAGRRIVDWAFAAEPSRLVWAVRDDGALLGLTLLREQEVYAWTRHDTQGGRFEAVCVVSEANAFGALEDVAYLSVLRTVGGRAVRTLERLRSRQMGDGEADVREAWHVDCGLRYRGAPATEISGLDHLEGATVAVLADGSVVSPRPVVGGRITLDFPASVVTVGLPVQSAVETLPLDLGAEAGLQGRRKRLVKVRLFVENARGLKVGPVNPDKGPLLVEMKERSDEPWGTATRLRTGQESLIVSPSWDELAVLRIQQDHPLPFTLLGVQPEFDVGA